jgi:uncharacterized membrane protein YeiH
MEQHIYQLIYILDLVGTFVFAISGALSAGEKRMDLFGGGFIASVTALGGGTIRDLCLGNTPVGWLNNMEYMGMIFIAVLVTFFFGKYIQKLRKTLFLFDTIGIAVFTIIGIEKGLGAGISPMMASIMGLFSAVVGGIIRDTLSNDIPLIFRGQIYATACLAGASVFFVLQFFDVSSAVSIISTVLCIITIRIVAVYFKLSLPGFKQLIKS